MGGGGGQMHNEENMHAHKTWKELTNTNTQHVSLYKTFLTIVGLTTILNHKDMLQNLIIYCVQSAPIVFQYRSAYY